MICIQSRTRDYVKFSLATRAHTHTHTRSGHGSPRYVDYPERGINRKWSDGATLYRGWFSRHARDDDDDTPPSNSK